ncbi:MAG: response regulator [Nitrospirae bacterium]|nr:response regulator [Nitrospirota bacterium]
MFSLLLVDDSNITRRYVKNEMLSILKYDDIVVTEWSNGKEACVACQTHKVDLMLIDLKMPEMDGYDVLECLKKHGMSIKTIVLSGDIQPGVEEIVKSSGAIGLLKKPFNREQVAKVLKQNGFQVRECPVC